MTHTFSELNFSHLRRRARRRPSEKPSLKTNTAWTLLQALSIDSTTSIFSLAVAVVVATATCSGFFITLTNKVDKVDSKVDKLDSKVDKIELHLQRITDMLQPWRLPVLSAAAAIREAASGRPLQPMFAWTPAEVQQWLAPRGLPPDVAQTLGQLHGSDLLRQTDASLDAAGVRAPEARERLLLDIIRSAY